LLAVGKDYYYKVNQLSLGAHLCSANLFHV